MNIRGPESTCGPTVTRGVGTPNVVKMEKQTSEKNSKRNFIIKFSLKMFHKEIQGKPTKYECHKAG